MISSRLLSFVPIISAVCCHIWEMLKYKVGEVKLLYNLFWDVNVLCLLFITVSYFLPYDINDVFKEFIISRDTPSNHYNTRQRMIFLATESPSVNCGPTWSLKVSLWTLWHSLGEIVGQVQSCQLCCVLRVIHLPWGAEGGMHVAVWHVVSQMRAYTWNRCYLLRIVLKLVFNQIQYQIPGMKYHTKWS